MSKKRINIYIEPAIYKKIGIRAKKDKRSITSMIEIALEYYLGKTKDQTRPS